MDIITLAVKEGVVMTTHMGTITDTIMVIHMGMIMDTHLHTHTLTSTIMTSRRSTSISKRKCWTIITTMKEKR